MRLAPLLALILAVPVVAGLPDDVHVPLPVEHNDAGSGRDAPDGIYASPLSVASGRAASGTLLAEEVGVRTDPPMWDLFDTDVYRIDAPRRSAWTQLEVEVKGAAPLTCWYLHRIREDAGGIEPSRIVANGCSTGAMETVRGTYPTQVSEHYRLELFGDGPYSFSVGVGGPAADVAFLPAS